MNTKALYWIALGTFAIALNSEYRNGGLPVAHQVAERAQAVYCQIAARAEQTLEVAGLMKNQREAVVPADVFVARHQAEFDRALAREQANLNREMALHQAELNRAMAIRQAELARMQERVGRVQMVMDRVQVEKLQKLANFKFNFNDGRGRKTIIVCPETGAKIAVDINPEIDVQ